MVVGLEPWGGITALDVVDGEPMWSLHLVDDLGGRLPSYGFGSSPIVAADTVILNAGGAAGTVIGLASPTIQRELDEAAEAEAAAAADEAADTVTDGD